MIRLLRPLAALALCALAISACSSVSPRQYEGVEPAFVLEEYFVGKVEAWGLFQGRSGEVQRRFSVIIDGRMEGDTLVLDERFRYADGERDRRVWRIERIDAHRYEGRADDVIGVARGERYGNALRWQYTLRLETEDGSTWDLAFDDWMYRLDDAVVVNRAEVSKFGITVGEVTLFFRKVGD